MDKTWMDVFINVVDALVNIVLTVGLPYLFSLLKKKIDNDKAKYYMDLAQEYLKDTVIMVKQTFVDNLKAEGQFNAEAQKQAFEFAMETWLDMMSDNMKDIIIREVGDLEIWASAKLEKAVVDTKA